VAIFLFFVAERGYELRLALWSLRNKCDNHARITVGPWEKALSIAHYALPIVSQGGLTPQLSPANQWAMRNARWTMLFFYCLNSATAALSRY